MSNEVQSNARQDKDETPSQPTTQAPGVPEQTAAHVTSGSDQTSTLVPEVPDSSNDEK